MHAQYSLFHALHLSWFVQIFRFAVDPGDIAVILECELPDLTLVYSIRNIVRILYFVKSRNNSITLFSDETVRIELVQLIPPSK